MLASLMWRGFLAFSKAPPSTEMVTGSSETSWLRPSGETSSISMRTSRSAGSPTVSATSLATSGMRGASKYTMLNDSGVTEIFAMWLADPGRFGPAGVFGDGVDLGLREPGHLPEAAGQADRVVLVVPAEAAAREQRVGDPLELQGA